MPQNASDKSVAKQDSKKCSKLFKLEANVLKGSKLGKAINYALHHQDTFMHVLLDGRLELSNNKAEFAVKSQVMGRKNWLFHKALAVLNRQELS